jgi:hypothetical protein
MVEAYPLQWPIGRPRLPAYQRKRSNFDTNRGRAIAGLLDEIRRLGGRNIVISSNLATYEKRGQQIPYANQSVTDPGFAVYFERKGRQQCFALDKYTSIDDNIHAIELTIAALRGIERWGGAEMMDAAFSGFQALPSPEMIMAMPQRKPRHVVLGVNPEAPTEVRRALYRQLARRAHPDTGGTREAWDELQRAAQEAGINDSRAQD